MAIGAAAAVMHASWSGAAALRAALLVILCVGYAEAAGRIERIRLYLGGGVATNARSNPTSIWTFAGALMLPSAYAVGVVVAIYGHIIATGYQQRTLRPYRVFYDVAAVTSGVLAAEALRHGLGLHTLQGGAGPAITTALALVVYSVVSLVVLLAGVYLYLSAPSLKVVLPGAGDVAFEAATLVLGLAAAALLLQLPWAAPLMLIPVAVLHRSTMIAELAAAARTDAKTGLLTSAAWHQSAHQQLSQARRNHHAASVLVLDLDRFKALNDQYGHLAGDVALRAIATCLRDELRDYDAIGRFGGEEFVALLPEVDAADALRIAERIRIAVHSVRTEEHPRLRVTASIGVAAYPRHGDTVEDLFAAADAALYAAKAAGRDRAYLAAKTAPAAR